MPVLDFPITRPDGVNPNSIWIFGELAYGFLGLDADGSLAGIFPVDGKLPVVGRNAGAMRIDYREDVDIEVGDKRWKSNCCIASVSTRDLDRSFRALAESVANELAAETSVTAARFGRAFSSWEQLFQRRRRLSLEEEQGLWGELYFLQSLEPIDVAVAAWRGPSAEDYDFLANGIALEVKTSRRFGHHHVSHAQVVQAVSDGSAILVSIWVGEDSTRGITLPQLIQTIGDRTQDPMLFEEKLLQTGYSHADAKLYDRGFIALDRPSFFDMSLVPRVREFDPGVTSLSYVVQLDPSLELGEDREALVRQAFRSTLATD
jgi:hypothetical protein